MIITTIVSSSIGATLAYGFKSRDTFHLVDLMTQEVDRDDPEQMALVFEKMKEAYEAKQRRRTKEKTLFRI